METFIKAIYPKKIIFHSQPNTLESRRFRSYLERNYSRKPEKVSSVRNSIKAADLQQKIFDKKFGQTEPKRVNARDRCSNLNWIRAKKPCGAKLVHSKPILQLDGEPLIKLEDEVPELQPEANDSKASINEDSIIPAEFNINNWDDTGSDIFNESDRESNSTSEADFIDLDEEDKNSSKTLELVLSESDSNKGSDEEEKELNRLVEYQDPRRKRDIKLKEKIYELFDNDDVYEEIHTPIANTQDFISSLGNSDFGVENEELDNSDLVKMMEDQKMNVENYDILLNQ